MVKPFLSENVANNVTLHSGDLATLRKHFRYLLSNSHRILNSNLLDLHRKKGVWDRGYFYPLFLVVVNTFPCRFLSWVLLLLESLYSCPFVWHSLYLQKYLTPWWSTRSCWFNCEMVLKALSHLSHWYFLALCTESWCTSKFFTFYHIRGRDYYFCEPRYNESLESLERETFCYTPHLGTQSQLFLCQKEIYERFSCDFSF